MLGYLPVSFTRGQPMHPPKVGIGVLIIKNNKLLLGNRLRSHGTHTWGPPGGHLEFGETFEQCAIREIKEEINLDIPPPVFVAVTNDIFVEEQKHYVSIFLKVDFPEGQVIQNLEPEKISSWEWFDIDALPDNLFLSVKNLIKEKGLDFLKKLNY